MASDKEQLEEQIRMVKEVLAIKEKQAEIAHSEWRELQKEVTIPLEYRHLLNQNEEVLNKHLERLEQDLSDLEMMNYNDEGEE